MELKEVLAVLESFADFKQWKLSNKDCFLAHAFMMVDELNNGVWQIGFFDSKKKLITTVIFEAGRCKIIPDQEILKTDSEILPLDFAAISVSISQAITSAQEVLQKDFGKPAVVKLFFIIQQIGNHPVYNVTFFTRVFKTINVKIDAVDGKVSEKSESVLASLS